MSSTIKEKILVPIGFTDQSILALQQAVIVAKHTNSELFLLSVVEMPSVLQKLFSDYEDQQKVFKEKVRNNLNQLVEQYCQGIEEVECMVVSGKIYDKIVETADMINASIIFMGTDGTPKDIKKKFIGSNAYNTVRLSSCPVVTLKGKEIKNQCKVIALPLDLNKETREKVTYAIKFARLFDSEVKIYSVTYESDDDSVKNKLKRNLSQVNDFIQAAGIPCSMKYLEIDSSASFSNSILDYAMEINADFMMIMTKDESNLEVNFLGSVARKIINKSDIPVMSIQPSSKKDTTSFTIQ
jgi:nucleotide-binding universal stress UspA family protein